MSINKKNQRDLPIFFLLLPLAMHWLLPEGPKWEQPFTTISLGHFKYSWIIIFYVVYYLLYPKHFSNHLLKRMNVCFGIGILICPLALFFINDGSYAFGLFLSAIPFYLIPYIIITRPPQLQSFSWLKIPLAFILFISVFQFVQIALFSFLVGSFDERPSTLVGSVNISSYFIAILSALFVDLYVNTKWLQFSFLLLIMGLIIMGGCRGAILIMGLYIIIILLRTYKKSKWSVKLALIATMSFFIYYTFSSELFSVLTLRNELAIEHEGDLSSGRSKRQSLVINNTFFASPIIGVGHGRVFPSSKDLLELRDNSNFRYSLYAGAPHNVFILALAEYGLVGVILVLCGLILLFKSLNYNNNLSYLVVLMILVLGNFETILVQDDIWPLFWIIVAISAKSYKNIQWKY